MKRFIVFFVVIFAISDSFGVPAPWRQVAAGGGGVSTRSNYSENCVPGNGAGTDDNEILYLSSDGVYFECERGACVDGQKIAVLDNATIKGYSHKAYKNHVFECGFAMDDLWKSIGEIQNCDQSQLAGHRELLSLYPDNASPVLVSKSKVKYKHMLFKGNDTPCRAYQCKQDGTYVLKDNKCVRQICKPNETRTNKQCNWVAYAKECKEKCVDGVSWEFDSLVSCAQGYKVSGGNCVKIEQKSLPPQTETQDKESANNSETTDTSVVTEESKPGAGDNTNTQVEQNSVSGLQQCSAEQQEKIADAAIKGRIVAASGDNVEKHSVKEDGKDLCFVYVCKSGFKVESGKCVADETTPPVTADSTTEQVEVSSSDECTKGGGTPTDGSCDCGDKVWNNETKKCEDKTSVAGGAEATEEKKPEEVKKPHSEEELEELQDKVDAAKEKEQSFANRMLSGATMAATGAGGQMLASALSEQNADADAERDMAAYLATFRCNWGSNSVPGGEQNVALAGGNELISLYQEYVALANDLKIRKSALDMTAGIESEPILDGATSGLYDDVGTGITSGAYASLARALMDPSGVDAQKWAAQKEETQKQLKTGAITAGVGAVVGLAGNALINHTGKKNTSERLQEKYKDVIVKLEKIEKDLNNAKGPKCSDVLNTNIGGNSPKCMCGNDGETFHPDWKCYMPQSTTSADAVNSVAEPEKLELVETIKIPTDIAFESAKDTLTRVAINAINDIKKLIGDNSSLFEAAKYEIHIIGHTDRITGTNGNQTNVQLSANRAKKIKTELTTGRNPIDATNVESAGVGSTGCDQDNDASCRYIEMKLYVNPDSISGLDGDFIRGLADGIQEK